MGVEAGTGRLPETSSLDRLQATKSGWFWDRQIDLWDVKVDFADAQEKTSKSSCIH